MKIIFECEKCGNRVEILPETYGNVAYLHNQLVNKNFDYDNPEIDVELQQESVTDTSDVETNLKEVQFNCKKCGEYIILSF